MPHELTPSSGKLHKRMSINFVQPSNKKNRGKSKSCFCPPEESSPIWKPQFKEEKHKSIAEEYS